MIPKHPNSCYKTDTAADKLSLGIIVLLIVGVCLFFLAFTIIKIGLIGLLLVLLGIGGFFTLSYIVGNWIVNRIEGRR
jgi:hypothetical protein